MLAQIAVVPSAPLLVPELAGPAAFDAEPVRAATVAAGGALAEASRRWVAVGVADQPLIGPDHTPLDHTSCAPTGDFGAYGAAVPVLLPKASGDAPPPLAMLVAGWVAAQCAAPPSSIWPVVVDPALSPAAAEHVGRELDFAGDEPVGLLVVADGATALSPGAPGGGERASAWALQRRIDAALAAADPDGLAGLGVGECEHDGVGTRAAWQVLAGVLRKLNGAGVFVKSEIAYAAAPFGVGYSVATLVCGSEG